MIMGASIVSIGWIAFWPWAQLKRLRELESNTEAPILVLPPRGCHLPARGVAPSSIRSARRQRCWPWLVRP